MLLRRLFGKNQAVISPENININRTNNSNVLSLENLPNELLYVIFDYLYCHEIIYAFDKLNSHFQSLLDSYAFYHLILPDEKIKTKLNFIRQLPLNTEHVKSLILSDDFNSVININTILSIYPMKFFSSTLQYLSLKDLDDNLRISIVSCLPNFQQLKALSISNKYDTVMDSSGKDHIRDIILFTIPSLRYFTWNIKQSILNMNYIVRFTKKSTIEYFRFHSLSYDAFQWLHSHTLNLKSISIFNPEFSRSRNFPQTFDKLVVLKFHNINSKSDIQFIFECLIDSSQLKRLELCGQFWNEEDCIDGYKWEDLIEKYSPQLEVFNFFFILIHWTTTIKLNQMIESFKTNFWLIKKKWFVTCDYQPCLEKRYFYSIPCIQSKLEYSNSWIQISTTTYNDTRHVHQLIFDSIDTNYLDTYHRCTHIQSLIIRRIHDNLTYDQLNRIINLLSIRHFEFQSKSNNKFFFDILKSCSALVSIEIDFKLLTKMIEEEQCPLDYLKKIKFLKLTYLSNTEWQKTDIDNFSSYFPNIEELFIKDYLNLSNIAYLIGSFKHLYFLAVHCSEYGRIKDDNIHNKLFRKQNRIFKKKNIIYRWMEDILYIWVDDLSFVS